VLAVDRNNSYSPAAPAASVAAGAGAGAAAGAAGIQRPRPARLADGLSRANNAANLAELKIEVHAPPDTEPVPSSCGCMTDLSHHQFHHHHHPPTPHYHGNSDVTDSPTDEIGLATPANDLLSLGAY